MREKTDLWYIRFPDGRVLRADGTAIIRQQLAAGRIPAGTHMRRSLEEEWRSLERYPEFADLTAGDYSPPGRHDGSSQPHTTIASRVEPLQFHQVGFRGLLEELLAAMDSTAVRVKLSAAGWTGALLGVLAGLAFLPFFSFEVQPLGPGWALVLGGFLLGVWLTAVLSRLTFTELSRLRPARWADGLHDIGTLLFRLVILLGGAVAVLTGLILVARSLPELLLESAGADGSPVWQIGAQVLAVVGLLVEVLAWALLLLLLPLGPLLVVEGCSTLAGLARWVRLVRQNLVRLLLAECLAMGIAFLMSLPLALLLLALWSIRPAEPVLLTVNVARAVLSGMAGALVLAYVVVANVFLYLHFRYDVPAQR
jgi:hypothetical protein